MPWPSIAAAGTDADRGTEQKVVLVQIDLDDAPADTADAYLRLHLLSHRLVQPNTINLDGVFGKLPNVVWTNFGPCSREGFELTRAMLRSRGAVTVYGVDKFPRMVDYVARPACASPTPTACASAPTSPKAPRSCTRAS